MSNEPAVNKPEEKPRGEVIEVALAEAGTAEPKSLREQFALARVGVQSGLLGRDIDTEQKAMVVMQYGAEIGFKGLAAFNYIYVVGGRPRLRPDGAKALALRSGVLEDFREELVGEGETREAVVTIKRKGVATPVRRSFSMLDAKRAKLAGKDNWTSYPDRLLLARARGFAFQDLFADLTGGLQVRETYDLEPGEKLAETPASAPRPKTGADPLLAKLGVSTPAHEFASHAEVEVQPYPSHAEADKAIAESEK